MAPMFTQVPISSVWLAKIPSLNLSPLEIGIVPPRVFGLGISLSVTCKMEMWFYSIVNPPYTS